MQEWGQAKIFGNIFTCRGLKSFWPAEGKIVDLFSQ
jgi:hypothetical protein